MKRPMMLCTVLPSAVSLAACGPAKQAPEATAAVAPAALPTDAWIGDWIGVEGNTLKIAATAAPGAYAITEVTLDGPLTYTGTADAAAIAFQEKDKPMTIRAGTGDETGLKYLTGKTNCLWIETGRGFCRD